MNSPISFRRTPRNETSALNVVAEPGVYETLKSALDILADASAHASAIRDQLFGGGEQGADPAPPIGSIEDAARALSHHIAALCGDLATTRNRL